MAEREGFEPSIRDKPHTPLAGEINNSVDKFPDMELSDVAEIKIQKTRQLSLSLSRENEDTKKDTNIITLFDDCAVSIASQLKNMNGLDKDIAEDLMDTIIREKIRYVLMKDIIQKKSIKTVPTKLV